MLFNSYHFLVFIIVLIPLFIASKGKRWVVLLIASYVFYMLWKWEYIFLIIISTLVDYYVSNELGKSDNKARRKALLGLSLTVNLGILFFYKYFEFFIQDVFLLDRREVLGNLEFLLPVGISFYTFQTLSYTIDVYNRVIKPERHLGKFALFVSYFPQLVAGPIERAGHLIVQINKKLDFKTTNLIPAGKIFLWGLFKKVVIADRVALIVDPVFSNPESYGSEMLILASVMFAIQIYCDFSGYCDMAIGISRLFNVKLSKNFNSPYFSFSITNFWRRWHISLSTWFKDYVYIPLGGNRVVKWRWYYNLFITFVLSGLWHGANWTFILWGAFHGTLLILERVLPYVRIHKAPKMLFVFILVTIGWIMFRAENVHDALYVYSEVFSNWWDIGTLRKELFGIGIGKLNLIVAAFSILLLIMYDLKLKVKNYLLQSLFYLILIFSVIIFSMGEAQAFIYFQF